MNRRKLWNKKKFICSLFIYLPNIKNQIILNILTITTITIYQILKQKFDRYYVIDIASGHLWFAQMMIAETNKNSLSNLIFIL
jgi:hypothetical protein